MASRTLYILYNADASVMGKLTYAYRKIKGNPDCTPACAACDITHGGLSLKETDGWVEAKKEIESKSGMKVVQWHRDEIESKLKDYVKTNGIRYPSVILDEGNGSFKEVVTDEELAVCKGDPKNLVTELSQKGVLGSSSSL